MTRLEHMEWSKARALEYVDAGNLEDAFSSMSSDLQKHPETANHIGIQMGMMQMMNGHLSSVARMRDYITDFN